MDYKWEKIEEHGQSAIGFLEMYKSTLDNQAKILAVVNYFPQLPFSNYKEEATVNFYFEGNEGILRKSLFRSINNDMGEIILSNKQKMFPEKTNEKIEHTQIQFYIVEKIPALKYYTHGDFAIIEEDNN